MDYVKKESIGKAAALQTFGVLAGEAFAISVMFGYSKRAEVSHYEAFAVAAILIALLSSVFLCIVRNPKVKLYPAKETTEEGSRQEYRPPSLINETEAEQTHPEPPQVDN